MTRFVQRRSVPFLVMLRDAGSDGLRPKDMAPTTDAVGYQTARTRLSAFRDRGLVTRVAYGRYRITVEGRRMLAKVIDTPLNNAV